MHDRSRLGIQVLHLPDFFLGGTGPNDVVDKPRSAQRTAKRQGLVRAGNQKILGVQHRQPRSDGGVEVVLARLNGLNDPGAFRGEHALDEFLIAPEFGPVVAPNGFVEVRGPRVAEWIGQIEHPVMAILIQRLKCRGIRHPRVTPCEAHIEGLLPPSLGRFKLGIVVLHKLPLLGQDGAVGRRGFKWEALVHFGHVIGVAEVPTVDIHHVQADQSDNTKRHPLGARPVLHQSHRSQEPQDRKSQCPQHVRPEHIDAHAHHALAHLLEGHVRANGAREVEEGLGHGIERQENQHRGPASCHPSLPAFGRFRLAHFVQRHDGAEGHNHLGKDKHHLGVSELAEQRNMVEKHGGQPRGIAPRQHHRQSHHGQHRPAQPRTPDKEPGQAQGKGQGTKVKRSPAEALLAPVQLVVSAFHIGNGHAPPLPSCHAVLQNVFPVQPVLRHGFRSSIVRRQVGLPSRGVLGVLLRQGQLPRLGQCRKQARGEQHA